ncbi:YbhB/YbcL family Raf kinase inhibitor-like protein [Peterkaempfera griseoplana]|uniref:YbhB/YbcL family Raf kinase inhibitor-like protein n=1 Tax=Peterkaempfera griseoplana TaxID=66896 RepID=UPI00099E38CD|nr:YbhB/YbcL family Raf kinase inhibitor-like protein [Peterkaempfera griseoplana]
MKRHLKAGTALLATAAVATTVGTSAASALGRSPASGPAQDGGYGYTRVRAGVPDSAARFTVTSPDVRDGGTFPAGAWADAFGCTGANRQVRLSWSGAPRDTRSYAVTMFDPDAPTGSGFWHWLVWDIPATTPSLGDTLPDGAVAGTDDAGRTGYLGPCPPAGDVPHRYEITVYALDVPSLQLAASTPAAVTAFTMSGHVVGRARLTATARR